MPASKEDITNLTSAIKSLEHSIKLLCSSSVIANAIEPFNAAQCEKKKSRIRKSETRTGLGSSLSDTEEYTGEVVRHYLSSLVDYPTIISG